MIEIITEADYKDRLAATQNGVLLFFKKLCPHCKNMEKVLEKFGAAKPGIALYGIDIEENAAAAAALGGNARRRFSSSRAVRSKLPRSAS
ncbi:MAG: thioredoxin family protein [Bilophila wadsworthia]